MHSFCGSKIDAIILLVIAQSSFKMAKQKLNYKKMASFFLGFAAAKLLLDYFTKEAIDFYGVLFIPLIALGLIYLIDKKRFIIED